MYKEMLHQLLFMMNLNLKVHLKSTPKRSSGASMGGGYTQNIQVKDSSTGQMITQVVTQEMINSNPSLARF